MSKKNKDKKENVTPGDGNGARQNDAPVLSEEELEILAAARKSSDRGPLPYYDNSDIANAKRYAKNNKFKVLFVSLTVLLSVAVIVLLSLIFYRNLSDAPSKEDFQITLGDEKYVVKYKSAMRDEVLYLDVIKIAEYAGIIVTGDESKIKLTCPDGTYARFENDKKVALVNGENVKLSSKVRINQIEAKDGNTLECLLPYDVIQRLFSAKSVEGSAGVGINYSDKTNKIIIRRITYADSGEPLPVTFSADCFELASLSASIPDNVSDERLYYKMTALINKNHPLDANFTPKGLVSLNDIGCPVVPQRDFLLCDVAANALVMMLSALREELGEENGVRVTSAYRSYEYQSNLYDNNVAKLLSKGYSLADAEKEVSKTSARPGESEHQSGLCVDLLENGKFSLGEDFEDTEAYEWLSENAHKYGYILRYPKAKTNITKYDFEPWHYRFVGIDAATVIYEDGICLEEYLAKF